MTSVLCPSTTKPSSCHYSPSPSASLASSVTTSSTTSSRSVAFTSTMPTEGFALASIKGNVHLVHVHTTHTPLLELRIFRHEFITIFRFSHSALVDPAEVRILESIGDKYAMYEEESDTVVLAKDLTERLLSRRAGSSPSSKRYSYGHGRQMYAPMGMQRAYAYR